jgi:polyphenol oxidase
LIRQDYGPLTAYEFESLRPHRRLAHGIFTRHGGVSPSPWHSLNLSTATGDSRDHIDENYRRVYGALGHSPDTAISSHQVHGSSVAVVTGEQRGQRLDACDGLVTDEPGIVLLQRHADCVPILLYDPKRPAIGVAHAGWRGTLAGVPGELVRAMCEAFGSRPADLIAAVGPSIGPCCYDIGAEVQRGFIARHADAGQWLAAGDDGRVRLDLWEANRAMLAAAGVREIEVAGICTACNVDEFYSARAENRRNGCFGAVIALV